MLDHRYETNVAMCHLMMSATEHVTIESTDTMPLIVGFDLSLS